QEEYQQRLAVKTQLEQAQHAAQSARLRLNNLKKEGVGPSTTLKAQSSGIVTKVAVQEGQLVAAGIPLVEIAIGDRIEARLGIEPEDVSDVHEGDPVELTPVHLDPGKPVTGHVRLVTKQLNPATELIEVLVSLPQDAHLTLSAYVRGTLITDSKKTLVVPREAVLPEKNGYTLYTVKDGHAVRHLVHIGLETDKEVEIQGVELKEGEPVVLAGNYELQPGMAVSQQTPP
ncbi:MAG: efflux RND transporter periplasmic adaptor subunit, partial [Steroidobacteraceae bacterium]